ncbi:uncharacterized protein METZ01_LOCUS235400 [marine metagenome]|uniref:Uncharacterized protein n=1 Tax=marine metagenome TaxID=408172 RepID=A0A382H5H8_9ZZZZ
MLKKLLLIALQKIVNLLFPKLRQNGLLEILFALIDMLCCQLVAIELWIYSNITVTCLTLSSLANLSNLADRQNVLPLQTNVV